MTPLQRRTRRLCWRVLPLACLAWALALWILLRALQPGLPPCKDTRAWTIMPLEQCQGCP